MLASEPLIKMLNFSDKSSASSLAVPLAASSASVVDAVGGEIASSRLRWLVLFLYGLQSICNAVLWITFAPVTAAAGWYFDTTDTGVNILSLTFMIVYLPGSIMAAWVFNRHGLRAGIWCGAVGNVIAAGIRFAACGADGHARAGGYIIVLFGQIAGGLAQPFFTNSPAKLAGEWFPVSERNLATTVASMCNPLGIALGQILPTLLVDAAARDFAPLLMWQLIGIAALTGLTLLLFQPQPEFAPSIATRERRLTRAEQQQRRQR